MRNHQILTKQMRQLFYEVKNRLPSNDAKNIEEFIDHNEFGLAFETLCCQLYEYDITISKEFYEKIVLYGESIEIKPSEWLPLKELIRVL
jgi:hypothetical protein